MADAEKKVAPGAGIVDSSPLTVILGLGFVVLTIFLLAWLLRRLNGTPLSGNQQMKILSTLAVGTRERVVLIEVGGRQLLVGVAPGRVSLLQNFDQPVVDSSKAVGGEFSERIKQFLQQGMTPS